MCYILFDVSKELTLLRIFLEYVIGAGIIKFGRSDFQEEEVSAL
jgi:hypothetical protein